MPMLFRSPGFVVIDKPFDLRMDPDRNDPESAVASVRQGLAALYDIHEPRWIHRLDYATSGVVAVGRTRVGSAPVAPLFEQRLTSKLYLAVVEGHVGDEPPPVAQGCASLLTCTPMVEQQRLLRDEEVQGALTLKNLESNVLLKPPLPAAAATPTASAADALDTPVSAVEDPMWVSVDGLQTPPPRQSSSEAAADTDGGSAGSPHAGASHVKGGFIIDGPIGDGEEGTFIMRIAGKEQGGRAAQTHVQVVQRGYMDGKPVTRLLLKPRSGRRHQLRIHLQSIGHAIVGDVAYGSTVGSYRMCLHAWALALPLASPALGSKTFRSVRRNAIRLYRAASASQETSGGQDGSGAALTGGDGGGASTPCTPPSKKPRPLDAGSAAVEWQPPAQAIDELKQPTGKYFVNDQTAHWLCGVPDVPLVALTADPFASIVASNA